MTIIYDALTDLSVHKNETFRSFEELINNDSVTAILSAEEEIEEAKADSYIANSVSEALKHYFDIIDIIRPKLKGWTWERIPLLSQAILLMSIAHYNYVEKVDKRIIIDVAVTLAKKYIEEKQAKFIHALLDEVLA